MSNDKLQKIVTALTNASEDRFWGTISVQFQGGEPVVIRTDRTEKIDSIQTQSRDIHR